MKTPCFLKCLIGAGQLLLILAVSSEAAANEGTLNKADAREYFRIYAKLHPEKGDLYQQLVKTFPNTEVFTTSQIIYVTDRNVKKPKRYPVAVPKPPTDPDVYVSQIDTVSAEQAKKELDARDALELAQHKSWYALLA